jgi:hypothetical protein
MTQLADTNARDRQQWVGRVTALADQVEGWARDQGWVVEREEKTIREDELGEYTVPALRIGLEGGEIHLIPIALHVIGADGRVDLRAYPTLSRVKLVGEKGAWQIMTDSNVPLRVPWDPPHFAQLVRDLLS